jgi:predicted secreted protein
MGLVSGLVVYILLWWWVFLMTLPFGAKAPDAIETGHATSAPGKPMLWRKAAITTVIAGILFAIVYWVIVSGIISLDTA